MGTIPPGEAILPQQMLAGFAGRCGGYDRENRFFDEDFKDLKQAEYPTIPVPREFAAADRTRRRSASSAGWRGADCAWGQHAPRGDRHCRQSLAQRRPIASLDAR